MIHSVALIFSLFILNLLILNKSNFIGNFFKLIDYPINNRSIHLLPIPKIGGVIIFLNILIINVFLNFTEKNSLTLFNLILSLSFIFFLIGYLDDVLNLSPKKKLILIIIGIIILNFFNEELLLNFLYFDVIEKTFYLKDLNYIFTFFCIYLLLNTFNMIDGINGLSINIFLIWLFFLFIYSDSLSIDYLIYLAPSFITVLYFNLKNKVFIGNSGSYMLGGLISMLTIKLYNLEFITSNNSKNLYVENILLLFLIPGLDCARLFFYRIFILKKSFYLADNYHFHHLLMKKYKSIKTLIIYVMIILLPNIVTFFYREYILLVILFNMITYVYLIYRCFVLNND